MYFNKMFQNSFQVVSDKVAITRLAIGIESQVTRHVVAMEKVAQHHILTKCSKCNTFLVKCDLLNSENRKTTIDQLSNSCNLI